MHLPYHPLGDRVKLKIYRRRLPTKPQMREIRNKTINMMNKIFAIETAPAAIPPKPKIAATIATMKNTNAQYNIHLSETVDMISLS